MASRVYEAVGRGVWPFTCRYILYSDRIEIQIPLRFYWFKVHYNDMEDVEVRNPPVVWDAYKQGILFTRKYFLRIYKNDLADLFKHVSITKKSGFWRQVRIAPKNPEKFSKMLAATRFLHLINTQADNLR